MLADGKNQSCLALCSFHHCSTAIVNDLTELGEDQASWRECLSTHLMPPYIFEQLPDGQTWEFTATTEIVSNINV